jgi:lipoprotein NlpD
MASTSGRALRLCALLLLCAALFACGAPVYHAVRPDETLYSISFRYRQDFRDVARWNGIAPPYTVREGQVLRVAPPLGEAGRPHAAIPVRPPAPEASPQGGVQVIPLEPRPEARKPPPASAGLTWRWPAQGAYRRASDAKSGSLGLDIAGARGSPVVAAADGRVVYSGTGIAHYGNLLIIKHDERYLSAYAHNERLLVGEGDMVKAGQTVAEMGSSGTGTDAVKLHFEIRLDGEPVDPLRYLPPR